MEENWIYKSLQDAKRTAELMGGTELHEMVAHARKRENENATLRARIAELEARILNVMHRYTEDVNSALDMVSRLEAPPSEGEIEAVAKALYMNANIGAGLSEKSAQSLWAGDENRDAWFGQAKAAIDEFLKLRSTPTPTDFNRNQGNDDN